MIGGIIQTRNDDEVRLWARRLDATPRQIEEAVRAVGHRADRVADYLASLRALTSGLRPTIAPRS